MLYLLIVTFKLINYFFVIIYFWGSFLSCCLLSFSVPNSYARVFVLFVYSSSVCFLLLLLLLLKVCIYVRENWIRSLLMFCFAVVVVYFSLVASVCYPTVETCHSVFSKLLKVLFLLYLLFVFRSFHEDWVHLVVFDCGWGLRLAVCMCFWWVLYGRLCINILFISFSGVYLCMLLKLIVCVWV